MPRFAICIAFVTLAMGLLLTGGASAADGNPCGSSSFSSISAPEHVVWRMEVREDEAAYTVPSIHDRIAHNWSDDAKRSYRWTSTAAPIDAGTSTQLMAISGAVIGEGLPLLVRGDIVDVEVGLRGIDYGKGRAPAILQRVCAAQDKPCLDKLRETQDGKVSGVEIRGGDMVAGQVRSSQVLANGICSIPKESCRGKMAAALR